MLCVPTVRVDVLSVACALALRFDVPRFVNPSKNVTVPVGVTLNPPLVAVAVKVTDCPKFEGFEEETPMSVRWQILAREKLAEVDALMDRAQRMRTLLDQALACGCLRLDDCARAVRGCA